MLQWFYLSRVTGITHDRPRKEQVNVLTSDI